jgi:hypothetical protein
MWNFIKIAFKYAMVKKLDYDMDSLDDIESFYDEIYVLQMIKYEPAQKTPLDSTSNLRLLNRSSSTGRRN